MRALVLMGCVFAVSCGKPGGSDAGSGGGIGATGGGAGGGGGGGAATYTVTVVDGTGAPLAGVGARLENADSPWNYVEGTSGADGVVTLPATLLNPFHLTVAKAGYGALSLIHLSNGLPAQVRLDALDLSAPVSAPLSGTITGATAGDTVIVSGVDAVTTFAAAPDYATTYRENSPVALPLMALRLAGNTVQNWVAVEGTPRGGALVVPLALPSTPAAVTTTTFSGVADFSGLLQQPAQANRLGLYLTDDGALVTGYGDFTATLNGNQVALSGTLSGVTGPYAPNRLALDISDQATFITHYYQGGDLTQPITVNLLSAQALATAGTSLGDVSASGDAPGFDTFALTVAAPGSRTCVWRAYTAPGTAFSITRLPALPGGATPESLGLGQDLEATARALKFADATTRPWNLPNRTGAVTAYRQTFDTLPRSISGTWRLEPVAPHQQLYAFKVVTPSGAAFPNAAVRVELQSDPETFVEGRTGNDGLINLTLSVTGPVNLTVSGANSGAVSFVGLTDDLPAEVRLDPLSTNSEATADLSVTIDNFDGGAMLVDAYAAQAMTSASFVQTSYITNSTLPLTVVALQLTTDGGINNWASLDGGPRSGAKDFTLSLPDPAQAVSSTSFTASWANSGLFAEPVGVGAYGLHFTSQPAEGFVTAGVATVQRADAGVITGAFTGITGPLAPNRLVVELTRGVNTLQHFSSAALTAPVSISLPTAQAIASTGTTLGDVAASATGAGFHALELQLSKPGQPKSPWRVYTGPGAPLQITRIPALPYGDAPASLGFGVNDQITAVPRLIRFADAASRPWQLANSVKPVSGYETTVTGAGNNVTGTWR